MKPGSSVRFTLVLTSLIPVAVAALVALTPLGSEAIAAVLTVGGVGALGVGVAVLLATRRLAALSAACEKITSGAAPSELNDDHIPGEVGTITRALLELEARRADAHETSLRTQEAFSKTLNEVTAGLTKLGDGAAVTSPTATGTCDDEVSVLSTTLHDASKKLGGVRQRLAHTTKVLHELGTAVIVLDKAGMVRYLNAGAERVLGRAAAACVRKEFRTLVAPPVGGEDPFGRAVVDSTAFTEWLKQAVQGDVVVEVPHAGGRVVRVLLSLTRLSGATDGLLYVLARDLTEEYGRLGIDRTQTREESLRAVWESTARAGTEAVESILASARLLTADAKQSSNREAMLQRLATVRQHAGGLEAYVRTVRWLSQSLWSELPQPLPSEFQAAEPVRAAIEQLTARFKARSLSVTVTDKGGWMCGDDEWIRTALLGVLSHTCESVQDASVGVRLSRVTQGGEAVESVAFEILDAGPLLTPAQKADLDAPFGAFQAPSFLAPDARGFIPGLVLARELARQMGGKLEFDATPSDGLIVRLVLPTRVPGGVTAPSTIEPTDMGPLEELVMGWRLGVA